jgi:maltooligosyltrehalose trehalohydrolase
MNDLNILRRLVGVNFNVNGDAEIMVWSPLAESVDIICNENIISLEKKDHSNWTGSTNLVKPGDRYSFLLNKEKKISDPASLSQPGGVHGDSMAIDLQFKWSDAGWKNYPLEQYLIYELHTGTFTPEGTFRSIEQKLDHLIRLGVTAVEIMPVAQFPGSRNWGYDGVYPFAVQNNYGGVAGLQQLVNACHQKKLAVVLDVVYNHLGPEGNYLGEFGPYHTSRYKTPWNNAINFDDAWCDGVRNYFIENALMWFRDFHIDALRLDAVHAIKDFGAIHFLQELRKYTDQLMQATGRTHYLIAECDLNDPKYINAITESGYGMDAQWIDEFHHALRVTAGGGREGYYSDFNGIADLEKSYRNAYVFDGQFSHHRKKKFGLTPAKNPGQQFIVFSQNHDHVGNRMFGERTSKLHSFEMQKLLAASVLLSPFIPLLFMGEEWGETNPFLYFVDHSDEELVEAVRKGRKEEFAAFHAEGEAPDPFSEESFTRSHLQWELLRQESHRNLFDFYRELIHIRKEEPCFKNTNRFDLEAVSDPEKNTLVIHRWINSHHAWCLLNFSQEHQILSLPSAITKLERIMDSADTVWKGPAVSTILNEETIRIQPESFIIYRKHV